MKMLRSATTLSSTFLTLTILLLCLFPCAAAVAQEEPEAAALEAVAPPTPFGGEEFALTLPPGKLHPLDASVMPPLGLLPKHYEVSEDSIQPKVTLGQETFETFPSSAWQVFSQSSVNAVWGRSSFRHSQGSFSAWCARSGSDAPAAGQDVPDNMASWMVTGPFNLSGVTGGDLAFDLWLETEAGFDNFGVAASINGVNYAAFLRDQNTPGWQRFTVNLANWGSLGDLAGRSQVWFAFLYQTDTSISFEGAYVDNAVLTADTASDLQLVVNQIDAGSCPSMKAFVVVNNGAGEPITGLTEANFSLGEDGTTQTIDSQPATGSGENLATTLVLAGSSSLSNSDVQNIKNASNGFIDLLAANDLVAVYHFASDVERVLDYTTNKNAAKAAVNSLNNSGSTSLYDAIVDAANYSTTQGGRRALVVMTDGRNNSSTATIDDAIAAANAAGVPVYTIGFGSVDQAVLARIANETGGVFFLGADSGDLQMILQRIGQQLANQYLLEWTAASLDGGTHNVTIGVSHQGQSDTKTVTYSQAGSPCANTTSCVPNATTMCLNNNRFRVRVEWTDFDGNHGSGQVVQSCGTDKSGLFWFFGPQNWEILMKSLDGCGLNQHYWVFFSATTNVAYTVTVTDTFTGARKVYSNPLGRSAPAVTDTTAFDCP